MECFRQDAEIFSREDRGAEVADTLGIDAMQPIDILVADRGKTVLDPLAHHRPLFARDCLHVLLVVRFDRLAKGNVEVRPSYPIAFDRVAVA